MTDNADVLKRSVTRDDYNSTDPRTPAYVLVWDYAPFSRPQADLPAWWSRTRDRMLRATMTQETLWAGAVSRAITKLAARGWTITDEGDSALRTKRAQAILLNADGGMGWVPFLAKVARDFLTTDNGAFIEVVRAGPKPGALPIGIMHLDSARCTRTGDLAYPVLYRDRKGGEHVLAAHQVLAFADLPDPAETFYGVGLCAASRAYGTIARQSAMNTYLLEKLDGSGATEIEFVQGLTNDQLRSVAMTTEEEMRRTAVTRYKGKVLVPIMSDIPVSGYRVQLKNVPDGFDPSQLREQAAQDYANALGIPVQDIIPLSGQGLGTGTQSVVLSEQAEGQGLAAFEQQCIHAFNTVVFDRWPTTMAWNNDRDARDKQQRATAQQAQATVLKTMLEATIISVQQAQQIAVEWDLIPSEFLPQDGIAGDTLSDDEKPITDEARSEAQRIAAAVPGLIGTPTPPPAPTTKDADITTAEMDALFAAELAAARRIAARVPRD
jgi:hypothetical protein